MIFQKGKKKNSKFYFYLFYSNSIVNSFLDYINRQNEDFRPKANDLSIELDNLIQTRSNEWKNLITKTKD
jgi:gamma-glutamylcysteine synthetase